MLLVGEEVVACVDILQPVIDIGLEGPRGHLVVGGPIVGLGTLVQLPRLGRIFRADGLFLHPLLFGVGQELVGLSLRVDRALDLVRRPGVSVLLVPISLPTAHVLENFRQPQDGLVEEMPVELRLAGGFDLLAQVSVADFLEQRIDILELRLGGRCPFPPISLFGRQLVAELVKNPVQPHTGPVLDLLARAHVLGELLPALIDRLDQLADRILDLIAQARLVPHAMRCVVLRRIPVGLEHKVAAVVLHLLRRRLAVLARKVVVNGVPPLMRQRASTLNLGQVDDAIVALIMRARAGQAMPAGTEGQRQIAIQGKCLGRHLEDFRQVQHRVECLVDDVLSLGIVVPVAELDAPEPEHVREIVAAHVPAAVAALFALSDCLFQRRVDAVVNPRLGLDDFDRVARHVFLRFFAGRKPILDDRSLPVGHHTDNGELVALRHDTVIARDLVKRNCRLSLFLRVEQLGPVAVAHPLVGPRIEDHELVLVGAGRPQVPILDDRIPLAPARRVGRRTRSARAGRNRRVLPRAPDLLAGVLDPDRLAALYLPGGGWNPPLSVATFLILRRCSRYPWSTGCSPSAFSAATISRILASISALGDIESTPSKPPANIGVDGCDDFRDIEPLLFRDLRGVAFGPDDPVMVQNERKHMHVLRPGLISRDRSGAYHTLNMALYQLADVFQGQERPVPRSLVPPIQRRSCIRTHCRLNPRALVTHRHDRTKAHERHLHVRRAETAIQRVVVSGAPIAPSAAAR